MNKPEAGSVKDSKYYRDIKNSLDTAREEGEAKKLKKWRQNFSTKGLLLLTLPN